MHPIWLKGLQCSVILCSLRAGNASVPQILLVGWRTVWDCAAQEDNKGRWHMPNSLTGIQLCCLTFSQMPQTISNHKKTLPAPCLCKPTKTWPNFSGSHQISPDFWKLSPSSSVHMGEVVVEQRKGKVVEVTRSSQPLQSGWITQLLSFLISGTQVCVCWYQLEPEQRHGMF